MVRFGKTGKVTDFRDRTATVGHACITLLREVTPPRQRHVTVVRSKLERVKEGKAELQEIRVDIRVKLLCWSSEGLDLSPPRAKRLDFSVTLVCKTCGPSDERPLTNRGFDLDPAKVWLFSQHVQLASYSKVKNKLLITYI